MYQGKIEAAPFDLFDVEAFDIARCPKGTGLRKATANEQAAYLKWIASRAGLYPYDDINMTGQGATFGRCETEAKWDSATRSYSIPQYQSGSYSIPMPGANQRQTVTLETLDDSGAVIASQSLPVEPKKHGIIWDRAAVRKAAGPIAKPAKARKASPPPAVEITETPPAVENGQDAQADLSPVQAQEPVTVTGQPPEPEILSSACEPAELTAIEPAGDWLALVGAQQADPPSATESENAADLSTKLADFVARLEAVEAACATLSHSDAHPTHENEQADAANVLPGPWKGARALHDQRAAFDAERSQADRVRRERTVRAYLRMRRERVIMRASIERADACLGAEYRKAARREQSHARILRYAMAMRHKRPKWLERAVKAERHAETLEFDIAELRADLANATARADAAESIAAPALDKAQARITELEERLAALPMPKVPFKLAVSMGSYTPPVPMAQRPVGSIVMAGRAQ